MFSNTVGLESRVSLLNSVDYPRWEDKSLTRARVSCQLFSLSPNPKFYFENHFPPRLVRFSLLKHENFRLQMECCKYIVKCFITIRKILKFSSLIKLSSSNCGALKSFINFSSFFPFFCVFSKEENFSLSLSISLFLTSLLWKPDEKCTESSLCIWCSLTICAHQIQNNT